MEREEIERELDLSGLEMVNRRKKDMQNKIISNEEFARRRGIQTHTQKHVDSQKEQEIRVYKSNVETNDKNLEKRILTDLFPEKKSSRSSESETYTQRHIDSQKTKGVRVYKSDNHKKKKKLVKKILVATLLTATIACATKKIYNVVTDADVVYYEVKAGDTLSSIADKFNTPVEEIYRNNGNIIGIDYVIQPGDILAFTTNPKLVAQYDETHNMEENKDEYYGRSK